MSCARCAEMVLKTLFRIRDKLRRILQFCFSREHRYEKVHIGVIAK